MPTGFDRIEAYAKKIDEKSKSDNTFIPFLELKLPKSGDTATVRFLEQGDDVFNYVLHDFSHIDGANGWKSKVPCLDQDDEGVPCPGCREELPRKFEGILNVIWRNAPIFKRDSDGKAVKDNTGQFVIEGYKDQVAIWRKGITVFKSLRRKDHAFKGLGTRDFEITREGEGLQDTSYSIEPADPDSGAIPLSEEDKKLAAEKYDVEKIARFVDADRFEEIISLKMNGRSGSSIDEEDDLKEFLNSSPYEGDE